MTEVTDQVRGTFATVARDVPVPYFDEVAFRAQVRRSRRRRTGRLALGCAAAAGVVAAAMATVPPMLDGGPRSGAEVAASADDAAPALEPGALPAPLYFTAAGRLQAATPDGQVHDLGLRSESIVGSTAEGVLAIDRRSNLVWVGATSSGEGDGAYTFGRGGPVTIPWGGGVQSVALSADGRWLAWLDLEDWVTVWDLKADRLVQSRGAVANSAVTAVSDRGVLVSLNGHLTMFGDAFDLRVPTEGDGYGSVSDAAGDFATVADRDDVTRIYDISKDRADGVAPLVDSVPGTGRLAPYARAVVSVDGATVRLWSEGQPAVLEGLGGTPQSAGWLDEDHALVTTAEGGGTAVYVCPVSEAACTPVAFSEDDIRLAD